VFKSRVVRVHVFARCSRCWYSTSSFCRICSLRMITFVTFPNIHTVLLIAVSSVLHRECRWLARIDRNRQNETIGKPPMMASDVVAVDQIHELFRFTFCSILPDHTYFIDHQYVDRSQSLSYLRDLLECCLAILEGAYARSGVDSTSRAPDVCSCWACGAVRRTSLRRLRISSPLRNALTSRELLRRPTFKHMASPPKSRDFSTRHTLLVTLWQRKEIQPPVKNLVQLTNTNQHLVCSKHWERPFIYIRAILFKIILAGAPRVKKGQASLQRYCYWRPCGSLLPIDLRMVVVLTYVATAKLFICSTFFWIAFEVSIVTII